MITNINESNQVLIKNNCKHVINGMRSIESKAIKIPSLFHKNDVCMDGAPREYIYWVLGRLPDTVFTSISTAVIHPITILNM